MFADRRRKRNWLIENNLITTIRNGICVSLNERGREFLGQIKPLREINYAKP